MIQTAKTTKSKKRKFYCSKCDYSFTADGTRQERKDPILGPVWRWQAPCPQCSQEVDQQKKPLRSKSSGLENSSQSQPSCATGSCPFIS